MLQVHQTKDKEATEVQEAELAHGLVQGLLTVGLMVRMARAITHGEGLIPEVKALVYLPYLGKTKPDTGAILAAAVAEMRDPEHHKTTTTVAVRVELAVVVAAVTAGKITIRTALTVKSTLAAVVAGKVP